LCTIFSETDRHPRANPEGRHFQIMRWNSSMALSATNSLFAAAFFLVPTPPLRAVIAVILGAMTVLILVISSPACRPQE
jgi:formate hydrogenlyase subunit 4